MDERIQKEISMDARVTRASRVFTWTTCAALLHAGAATAQSELDGTRAPVVDERAALTRVTLEGFVLAPDESPAEAAVVTSSAGGKALTDVAGSYRLDVEVPLEATSVEVTTVGRAGTNLAAKASVPLSAATRSTRVNPLRLSRRPSCSPSWTLTFGGLPGAGALRRWRLSDRGRRPGAFHREVGWLELGGPRQ